LLLPVLETAHGFAIFNRKGRPIKLKSATVISRIVLILIDLVMSLNYSPSANYLPVYPQVQLRTDVYDLKRSNEERENRDESN
jgi:hypothetical protein